MTFEEFIGEYAPDKCKVHRAFGRAGVLVLHDEIENNPVEYREESFSEFTNKKEMLLERIGILFPYPACDFLERERMKGIAALKAIQHWELKHKDQDWSKVKAEIESETVIYPEEREMLLARDYWN